MDNIFICDKCGKEFNRKSYLIKHQNRKIPCNNNTDKYKCNYCNKELSKTTKINKHLKTCKIYNEYELKQEKKNNNKELKILNNKVKEIEIFVEEQKNINDEQKNINEADPTCGQRINNKQRRQLENKKAYDSEKDTNIELGFGDVTNIELNKQRLENKNRWDIGVPISNQEVSGFRWEARIRNIHRESAKRLKKR